MSWTNTINKTIILFVLIVSVSCSQRRDEIQEDSGSKPEDNRFTPVILTAEGALDEPMMFEVADENSVFIIERKGALKRFDLKTRTLTVITTIDVFTGNEQGLIGLTLDPNFKTNHWIYLHYAPTNERVFKLARYEVAGDSLVDGSEK